MDIGKDIYSSARESCCGYPTNWPFGLGFRAEYACVFPNLKLAPLNPGAEFELCR